MNDGKPGNMWQSSLMESAGFSGKIPDLENLFLKALFSTIVSPWMVTSKKICATIEKFYFDWFGFGEVSNNCPFKPLPSCVARDCAFDVGNRKRLTTCLWHESF
jgi:hypothetical protein